jgi:hypothetical protein
MKSAKSPKGWLLQGQNHRLEIAAQVNCLDRFQRGQPTLSSMTTASNPLGSAFHHDPELILLHANAERVAQARLAAHGWYAGLESLQNGFFPLPLPGVVGLPIAPSAGFEAAGIPPGRPSLPIGSALPTSASLTGRGSFHPSPASNDARQRPLREAALA